MKGKQSLITVVNQNRRKIQTIFDYYQFVCTLISLKKLGFGIRNILIWENPPHRFFTFTVVSTNLMEILKRTMAYMFSYDKINILFYSN